MGKWSIIILVVVLLIVASGFTVLVLLGEKLPIPEKYSERASDEERSEEEEEDGTGITGSKDIPVGASSSGGGSSGGGGGGNSGSSVITCSSFNPVSYSLRNFYDVASCEEYNGDTCIRLFANCSVELFNLDGGTGGEFGLSFTLIDGDTKEVLDYGEDYHTVGPRGDTLFFKSFELTNALGINEFISCNVKSKGVPLTCADN